MKKKIILTLDVPELSVPQHLQKPPALDLTLEGFKAGIDDLEVIQLTLSAAVGLFNQYKNRVDQLAAQMNKIPPGRDIN